MTTYSERFDGATAKNGDRCNGFITEEDGRSFYHYGEGSSEYQSAEMPCIRVDITNATHYHVVVG